jgi:oligopeptidase B
LEQIEEIILDANLLAEGKEFYDLGGIAVSPNNEIAAFSEDDLGRRIYAIKFKNLVTGEMLEDEILNCTGKAVWAADNQHVFYIVKDKSLRAYQVFRHQLGTPISDDILIFHEKDETFDVNVYKTKSLDYIFISSSSSISDEHRYIPAQDVFAEFKIIEPRTDNLEYAVEHYQDEFYIITNADDATNFKLVKAKVSHCEKKYWQDIIPHRKEVLMEGFEIFKDYLVLEERNQGLLQIKIIDFKNNESYYLPFSDPTYTAYIATNLEFDTQQLRYGYTSMTQPHTTLEYDMENKMTKVLKQQEVLGGKFDSKNYLSERIWAPSRDGKTQIPMSLVYHKNTKKSAQTPLLIYGYGSYGHTVDAGFSNVRLSLLDRGFIYVIAHVRGGEYLGRDWYEDGKMLHKKKYIFRFYRCFSIFNRAKLYLSPTFVCHGRFGGRIVGRRSDEYGTRIVPRNNSPSPICRCSNDHVGRGNTTHNRGI